MIQLATEFFDVKNDPSQLSIDETVIERLRLIHPATMGEMTDENGPIAWTIAIPTTESVMNRFLEKQINEAELLALTEYEKKFTEVYLCSALVLPEHRGKGFAKQLFCSSIYAIQKKHSVQSLFSWAFSTEGDGLSQTVAKTLGLPLHKRMKEE